MRGIELILKSGIRLSLKSVVVNANRHELPAMQAFAAELGLKFRYDALIWPRLSGEEGPLALRMTAAEVAALDRDDSGRREAWEAVQNKYGGLPVRADLVYSCGAGFHSFHVDSEGKLSMCMMARRPAYDLLQGSFQEGWETFLGALREEKRKLDTACRTCTVGVLCTQCPGWSQVVHGDDETPVEFVCELAHLRAAQIIGPTT
jgi:radical SAM protein with 4Fe4S-binding SPASM domain